MKLPLKELIGDEELGKWVASDLEEDTVVKLAAANDEYGLYDV